MSPSTYQRQNSQSGEETLSALTKVDMTRDEGGCLYAPGDWKAKHQQLSSELTKLFGIPFRDNGNSMNSCFQFEAPLVDGLIGMWIKIYWKGLALV